MKKFNVFLLSIIVLFFLRISGYSQAITVDASKSADDLVKILTLVEYTAPDPVGSVYCTSYALPSASGGMPASTKSYGSFTRVSGSFPFAKGIILSTNDVANAVRPYPTNIAGGGGWSTTGDTDLETAIPGTPANSTRDITVLEFDFVALANAISFRYVFASNEYIQNFPCNYSDPFAFLIKESSSAGAYKNLAVLPDTTTPVSSMTVRPQIPTYTGADGNQNDAGCAAQNEQYFNECAVSYSNGCNAPGNNVNFAGQTKAMIARAKELEIGKTYHIKFVIADGQGISTTPSTGYDSAIFLEAGSFKPYVDLGKDMDGEAGNQPRPCMGEAPVTLKADNGSSNTNPVSIHYAWKCNGYSVVGQLPLDSNQRPLPVTITDIHGTSVTLYTGSYTVEATATYPASAGTPTTTTPVSGCITKGEIYVLYGPARINIADVEIKECDEDKNGITAFNLNSAKKKIINGVENIGNSDINFFVTKDAAKNDWNNPIPNPETYQNLTNPQTLSTRVMSKGCPFYSDVTLSISNNNVPPTPVEVCDNQPEMDGIYEFDLEKSATPKVLLGLPVGLTAKYYGTSSNAFNSKDELPNIYTNTTPGSQEIFTRVNEDYNCYAIAPVKLVVNTMDMSLFQEESKFVCEGTSVELVAPVFQSYKWDTGETTPSIKVFAKGIYKVDVTSKEGCTVAKTFNVGDSAAPKIEGFDVNEFRAGKNSVTIKIVGTGTYEYSKDNIEFQDSPTFDGLVAGEYTFYSQDKNGCGGAEPLSVWILDYLRLFSPNGDGINDEWTIKNMEQYPDTNVKIYNRYGKFLRELTINDQYWNGTFQGQPLPSDDYWMTVTYNGGKTQKGHFSLKRE